MNRMLSRLKIGKKLFIGYAIVITFAIILAISNMVAMIKVNDAYINLQLGIIEGNHLALKLSTEYAETRQLLIKAIIACEDGGGEYQTYFNDFDNSIDKITQTGESLLSALRTETNFTDAEKEVLAGSIHEALSMITNDYVSIRNATESRITGADLHGEELLDELKNTIVNISNLATKIDGKLNTATESTSVKTKEIAGQISSSTHTAIWGLCILAVVAILLSIISAMLIIHNIRNPIKELSAAAKEIAEGNLDTIVRYNAKDEIGILSNSFCDVVDIFSLLVDNLNSVHSKLLDGQFEINIDENIFPGDYKKAVAAVNSMINYMMGASLSAIQCAQSYASGNFEAVAKRYSGPQAILSETFDALQMNLKSVSNDLNMLINSVVEGKLDTEIDSNRYEGDWKRIAEGLNHLLKTVESPISEVCSVMEHISVGEFSANVIGDYKGSFAHLKDNINKTIKNSGIYVKDISDILIKMSTKDLDINITREYSGDFAAIKDALTQIIDTFNNVIGEVNISAEQVSEGAKLISESGISLSQGAVEQANTIEETSATTELISKQTAINAQNSEEVRILSLEAKNRGIESKADMEEMLKSMSNIGSATANISRIIKIIDDIAFQINLLALNAAVEAARAGSHGKGFSVVAEEVRNLAGKSKQAASETEDLINQTVKIVTGGTEIANNTADSINEMVEQITDIAVLIEGISSASKEQAVAIQQMNQGITQISGVTQSNATTAEESASMSQELSSQAETLRNTLSLFKYRHR